MAQYSLLSCITSDDRPGKARRKLKRRLKILGELRDTQVHRMFFELQLARFPELGLIRDFLLRRERQLVKEAAGKTRRLKTRKLEKWTLAFCRELAACPEHPHDLLATNVLHATTDAFTDVVRHRQNIDPANSETIHSTRVAFKKFRYLVEALSPAFTGLGKGQLRRFGNYQRRMGDLQDLEILQAFVARFINEHPETGPVLRPFCRYLKTRRARTLRSTLRHADDLFDLWNPPRLDQSDDAALIRNAA